MSEWLTLFTYGLTTFVLYQFNNKNLYRETEQNKVFLDEVEGMNTK